MLVEVLLFALFFVRILMPIRDHLFNASPSRPVISNYHEQPINHWTSALENYCRPLLFNLSASCAMLRESSCSIQRQYMRHRAKLIAQAVCPPLGAGGLMWLASSADSDSLELTIVIRWAGPGNFGVAAFLIY
ncbi:MAG: hypothetical protein LBS75_10085 [Synergistaceae bacterium]|jgi:hypothetical protein|nr:hypothetical protein [Synergistaceae bacterium]